MTYIIFGLGNPGLEYVGTRHNVGKDTVDMLVGKIKLPKSVKVIKSEEYMNNSGKAVAKQIKSKKAAKGLTVVHDDLDLPLGRIKISYNKSAGGHRGVASIVRALKTEEFVRVRIGIAPATPSGKIKKPAGEKAVLDFILGKFKPKEAEILKKLRKSIGEALELIVAHDYTGAMNQLN